VDPHARGRLRIYADTSVFGGWFDAEFAEASRRFFRGVRSGRILLLASEIVEREIERAPPRVRTLFGSLGKDCVGKVPLSEAVLGLRDAYIAAGVLTSRSLEDSTHVAAATVARADAIVSWNFRHIVRLDRMKGYNRINLQLGYGILTILTPAGVAWDEDDSQPTKP
jgi:hypothetical protein